MMKRMKGSPGMVAYGILSASALIALLSAVGILTLPGGGSSQADMRIEPSVGSIVEGETFTVTIVVSAEVPVNVFAGEIQFDPKVLQVASIEYNTSIADLWAELPWYENGEGTLNFAGGTTQPRGFSSTGGLITATFRTIGTGVTALKLHDALILAHDGLGSEVALGQPLDAVFEIGEEKLTEQTVAAPASQASVVAISAEPPSTDLNGDGEQTIVDMSIFMLHIMGSNPRYDFNQDGKVNTTDLSIIMSAR